MVSAFPPLDRMASGPAVIRAPTASLRDSLRSLLTAEPETKSGWSSGRPRRMVAASADSICVIVRSDKSERVTYPLESYRGFHVAPHALVRTPGPRPKIRRFRQGLSVDPATHPSRVFWLPLHTGTAAERQQQASRPRRYPVADRLTGGEREACG